MINLDKVTELYRSAFEAHGRSSASVLCPKGRHDLRFSALTSSLDLVGKRVLDFGCGLAHLCAFLDNRSIDCEYLGVDIVEEFIESNREFYPHRRFQKINKISDIGSRFDIVLASGVFNMSYIEDRAKNLSHVKKEIHDLFDLSDEAISVDFLTTHVDFVQDGAFHFDPAEITSFAIHELSRRVKVDHSYMPFEFCMTVFKTNMIDRKFGIYI